MRYSSLLSWVMEFHLGYLKTTQRTLLNVMNQIINIYLNTEVTQ